MIKAVFFDVNETLTDLSLLKEKFNKHFDDENTLKYWFTKLLQTSQIISILGDYKDFGELSGVVLEALFHERGKELTQDTKVDILGSFRRPTPHKDVRRAFEILKENNIRVVPVSNSSLAMMEEQITNGGLIDLVDAYYSVDSVKKYKPFSDIYMYAASQENLSPENIAMVACHDWDLYGAKKVGFTTAYVERTKEVFNPIYPKADIYETDLVELIKKIVDIK